MRDTIIIRSNEIILKGGNRSSFERALKDDVARRLAGVGRFAVSAAQGNVLARHDGAMTDAQVAAATERLSTCFGVAWFLFAARCDRDLEAIERAAVGLMAGVQGTFKVFASRSDKSFPADSQAIARQVGARVLAAIPGVSVDVKTPQVPVFVDVHAGEALVAVGRRKGPGGMPAGTAGTVVALLSGGIDSPVAAWKTMRRGCRAVLVHCHSYPYVGRASIDKVRRLASVLAGWQGSATLVLVPLGDAQREIVAKADPSLRVLLYRRMMLRLAQAVAAREGALALVTGDSIGQVASQTLENIAAVSAVAELPIFRPLIGEDKNDIVDLARTVGTYGISIEPHDDCCSLFMPPKPATRASAARLDAEEARYDVAGLVERALAEAETVNVTSADERATVAAPPWRGTAGGREGTEPSDRPMAAR